MANKKRMIDANELFDNVENSKYDNPHTNGRVRINHIQEHDHFMKMIFDAPTVDAVEVVRCKDCKYYEHPEYYGGGTKDICRLFRRQMLEDAFCSCGERRTDETD